MAITMERLEELRNMEYSEYLRTPEWQVTRKRILKRDQYQCQGCRAKGVVMNVHHLTYDRLGCEEDEDLVTLCEVCHEYVHGIEPELSFGHKTGVFLSTAVLGTIGLEGFLQAPLPAEIGLLLGAYFLAKQSPAMYRWLRRKLPKEMLSWIEREQEERREEYTFFERLRGKHLREEPRAAEPTDEQVEAHMREHSLFAASVAATNQPKIARLTIDSIVRHTTPNSYTVYIGRSMTKDKNPAIPIRFRKRHIKIIGASQYGKSSMAAAFLDSVVRTHDPAHVLIALLDLEDRTSRLFADIPHRVMVNIDGKSVVLHARSKEQVLEHLGYLVRIMDERYKLSESEVAQEPVILIYLEEFIALKDHFKTLARGGGQAEKRDYEDLVHRIKELARRGLKVYMQFLMCSQVDYRDEDLQEALINVTSGMSFHVRASAAQAAGFRRTDLINRNIADNMVGQAVTEMPDCQDLILAPDYNLEARLLALEEAAGPMPVRSRPSIVSPASSAPNNTATSVPDGEPATTVDTEEHRTDELDEQDLHSAAAAAAVEMRQKAAKNGEFSAAAAAATVILPDGWTEEEAIWARKIYEGTGSKEKVLAVLKKKGANDRIRGELDLILKGEQS